MLLVRARERKPQYSQAVAQQGFGLMFVIVVSILKRGKLFPPLGRSTRSKKLKPSRQTMTDRIVPPTRQLSD